MQMWCRSRGSPARVDVRERRSSARVDVRERRSPSGMRASSSPVGMHSSLACRHARVARLLTCARVACLLACACLHVSSPLGVRASLVGVRASLAGMRARRPPVCLSTRRSPLGVRVARLACTLLLPYRVRAWPLALEGRVWEALHAHDDSICCRARFSRL